MAAPEFKKPSVLFDGYCEKPSYQMVPAGDFRTMQFTAGPEDCEIYIDDPTVAGIANFEDTAGHRLPLPAGVYIADSFAVPKSQTVKFTVNGRTSGLTFLMYQTRRKAGDPNQGVQLSVKKRQSRSVSLLMVDDAGGNKGSRGAADINRIMAGVGKTFLLQCNLELKPAGNPKPLHADRALANPLIVDTPAPNNQLADILIKTEEADRHSDILVYFMWDIDAKKNLPGVDTLAECVSWNWKPNQHVIFYDDSQDAWVLAHEFGHALGLDHNLRSGSLMEAYVQPSRSSRLEQFEIDIINSDGTA